MKTPVGVSEDVWQDFLQHRKEKRKPVTSVAYKRLVKRLEGFRLKGMDLDEVLNISIECGWTGVFEVKHETHQRHENTAERFARLTAGAYH